MVCAVLLAVQVDPVTDVLDSALQGAREWEGLKTPTERSESMWVETPLPSTQHRLHPYTTAARARKQL